MSHYLRDIFWTGRDELKEREDTERRDQQDEGRDPWGYDEPTYPEYMAGMGENDGVPE